MNTEDRLIFDALTGDGYWSADPFWQWQRAAADLRARHVVDDSPINPYSQNTGLEKCWCLGGPADGRMLSITVGCSAFEIPVPVGRGAVWHDDIGFKGCYAKLALYVKTDICDENGRPIFQFEAPK